MTSIVVERKARVISYSPIDELLLNNRLKPAALFVKYPRIRLQTLFHSQTMLSMMERICERGEAYFLPVRTPYSE